MESSSLRNRVCQSGNLARRTSVQVRARDVVSDPANMKVLMLCRISSSEMRCSSGRSVAAFDLTRQRCECPLSIFNLVFGNVMLTEKSEKILALVRLPSSLPFQNLALFFLYQLTCHTLNGRLALADGKKLLVRLKKKKIVQKALI